MTTCIHCKSDNVLLDEMTNMYYCSDCNNMWDAEESQDSEPEPENGYEEEHLNGFALFMIHLLMTIPVLDGVVTCLVSNSDVEEGMRKTIIYRFFANMFLYGAICVGIVVFLKNSESIVMDKVALGVNHIVELMIPEGDVPQFELPKVSVYESLIMGHLPEVDENAEQSTISNDVWLYMDGVTMSGGKALSILDDIEELDMIVLIQTKSMRSKYDSSTYRCVGRIQDDAYINQSYDNWFYSGTLNRKFDFMVSDYGEFVEDSYKDLYSSRYIYYVNSKSEFELTLLYSEDEDVVGIALVEV